MNNKVRLLPVIAIIAFGAFMVKAVAIAESAGESAAKASKADAASHSATEPTASARPDTAGTQPPVTEASSETGTDACPAPDMLAEQAGLSQYEIQVLRSLANRREQLDAREASLDTRELTVSAAELRLNDQIDELKGLETSIDALLAKLDDKNAAQLDSLVKVYESMKPKDAARIFEGLDDTLMLSLADRMKSAAMAAILAEMASDRARTLTQLMAQKTEPPATAAELEARTNGP